MKELLSFPWPYQVAALFLFLFFRALLVAGGSALWADLSPRARARKIIPAELTRRIYALDILQGAKVLLFDVLFATLLIRTGFLHFAPLNGFVSFALTFLVLFVWVEIYFYYSHRLFHLPKFFWIHRHHHQASPLNPWTSLSFSLFERFILLLGVSFMPALVSFWVPFPAEASGAYFFVNYLLNVYGHLNTETLPPGFTTSRIGKVMNTSTYHALHHLRYRGHFGLFTSTLDKIHGTKFADYEAKQKESFERGQSFAFSSKVAKPESGIP